ncbi:hypothetical protein L0F63_003797 [Massospora cicadina]|nr:hypothetical protein L0F63_003797 [Massospora cicadina]
MSWLTIILKKVQRLDVNERSGPDVASDSSDSENRSRDLPNPYVNIEIDPIIQSEESKNKGKLSQLFQPASQLEAIDGSTVQVETNAKTIGGELPALDFRSLDETGRASIDSDLEIHRSQASKTRLPNLPPKDPEEERKHLAQFQKMMVASKQRDAAKASEAEKARMAKEDTKHRLTLQWNNDILPNWENPGVAARAEKLAFSGIPSSCRGQVWSRSLKKEAKGGKLSAITSETYAFLLERASNPPPSYLAITQRNVKHIVHDAASVFPKLGLFGPGFGGDLGRSSEPGPYYIPLLNVLKAHASLAPAELYENRAVGSLAGVLLLHMNEDEAFMSLQVLLCRPMHAAFALSTPQAASYLKAFDLAFNEKLPRVSVTFTAILKF